jgi:hypothetical protein
MRIVYVIEEMRETTATIGNVTGNDSIQMMSVLKRKTDNGAQYSFKLNSIASA